MNRVSSVVTQDGPHCITTEGGASAAGCRGDAAALAFGGEVRSGASAAEPSRARSAPAVGANASVDFTTCASA